MSVLTLEAKLERTENSTPWGFRMQGGKDFSSPLTIQRVNPGSLAAKCGLQVGDIILRIGTVATDTLKHKDAQSNIIDSGNRLDLLLQRIKSNPQVNGWGGNAYGGYNPPPVNNSATSWSPRSPAASAVPAMSTTPTASSSMNFNPTPKPFGSSANQPSYESNLAQQTHNLNLNSEPREVPAYQTAAEKYAERSEPPDPAQHQSKSFRYLQTVMDEGRELNTALKPRAGAEPAVWSPPSASQPPKDQPPPSPVATAIGPGSKPGTVKAIVSQRYNNPMGLYSSENASSQFEGQSKYLVEEGTQGAEEFPPPPADLQDSGAKKVYVPSETYRMVQEEVGLKEKEEVPGPAHSRTFRMLQAQLGSGAAAPAPAPVYKPSTPSYQPSPAPVTAVSSSKPWTPAPAPAPVVNQSARPFGSTAPPKPTGVGATRGKRGDAAMNPATLSTAGRIPVCSGCNMPIRGPFVTALGKCWCPDHFICANPGCGTKLLDIGFVEEGGFLYCEKDYAAHFAPHCDKCKKPVIGECVNAVQKSFHPECFLCAQCNQTIGGTKFHIEDGKFYCERDWAAMFQTMCSGCDFPIEPGDSWVEAMSKNFHSECFNCSTCQVNLEGQQFCAKGGKPYCKKHAR